MKPIRVFYNKYFFICKEISSKNAFLLVLFGRFASLEMKLKKSTE
jgi:hypothetical protein